MGHDAGGEEGRSRHLYGAGREREAGEEREREQGGPGRTCTALAPTSKSLRMPNMPLSESYDDPSEPDRSRCRRLCDPAGPPPAAPAPPPPPLTRTDCPPWAELWRLWPPPAGGGCTTAYMGILI